MSTVIKVENLSKQYRLGNVGLGSLSADINRWYQTSLRGREDPYLKIGEANDRAVKGESEYVWALQNINFEVQQGEVLGIIGRNGSGKSTLLKILSRTTAPTIGQIKIKGRVASLLEVGTGFHPELTGRENIFLNGAILGMTKKEIKRKFDEILDFAGVERYVDTPVKRYSSGMYVRLAFAVAAHLEPEVLIVDEVLAVGDIDFQKRALGKMKDVSGKDGRTVLFVSHNMAAVANLCNNGIVLNQGLLAYTGHVREALKHYSQSCLSNDSYYLNEKLGKNDFINEVKIIEGNGITRNVFSFDDEVVVRIKVKHASKVLGTHVGIAILDKWHQKVFTDIFKLTKDQLTKDYSSLTVKIPSGILLGGIYYMDVALFVPQLSSFDYVDDACSFEIEDLNSELSIFNGGEIGNVMIKCQWQNN